MRGSAVSVSVTVLRRVVRSHFTHLWLESLTSLQPLLPRNVSVIGALVNLYNHGVALVFDENCFDAIAPCEALRLCQVSTASLCALARLQSFRRIRRDIL